MKTLKLLAVLCAFAGFMSAGAVLSKNTPRTAPPQSTRKVHSAKTAEERVAEGKRLFETVGCAQCHSIENTGGCLAPPLDCVTIRDNDEYLMLRLGKGNEAKWIKRVGHPELMEHPRFAKPQLKEIIEYLRTLPCKVAPK